MNHQGKRARREKPLRLVAPEFYDYLFTAFAESNIHPYDIQARAIVQDGGLTVILRYGEGFTQSKTRFFTYQGIRNKKNEIHEFIDDTGSACKDILVADYYKMMKL